MSLPYAELHAHSCFSFRRGAATVEDLLDRAQELGLAGLAITDRDGLYGSVRQWIHHRKQREAADGPVPRAVYGADLGLADGSRLVVLVRDQAGWRNLSALISESRMACEKGTALLPLERVAERREGLFFLSGGRFGPIDRALLGTDARRAWQTWRPKGPWGRPLGEWMGDGAPLEAAVEQMRHDRQLFAAQRDDPEARLRRAREVAARLRDALPGQFFVEVSDHHLPEDQWLGALLRRVSDDLGIPRVVTGLVHYARPEQRRLQDVVSCIRLHTTLKEAGTRLLPNGHFGLRGADRMARLFPHDLEAVARSAGIAADCDFELDDLPYAFPVYTVPDGHTLQSFLEEQTWEGAAIRYGERLEADPRIKGQIRHELDVVGRMGLAGYFLIVWDISNECRRRGILSQGRGSAANSCVCYCLRITAVDPIRLDLLFERFLSEARGGYPDIDIDISNSKREEILQFVYSKYGRRHAAMVCNVITYHPRSAIRDVGKVFGLGLDQVDRMAKTLSHFAHEEDLAEVFGEEGEEAITDDAHTLKQVLHYTRELCGFPRHIGIHSGGVVISGLPIGEACPTENASMEDRTVLQWDKDDVAHTGLVKIDLLALGMLSVIQEASRLMALRGVDFEMAALTYDDPRVYDMICEADTVGMFQIESRAQMNTLPRLRPRCFHDLVVEVALIRPGPIQGEMVHPYLRRRNGEEEVVYAHPSLEPILKRTMGIPLFQEQAMKMAIATAGFTPGEADRLRKVMGFKRGTEELEQLFSKMVRGMTDNGMSPEVARRIREQLKGFAAYGFPESHAASFALIVYASGWLKRYEHAAFTGGLLNCQPLGFYSAATLIADARRHGVEIQPLCINLSDHRWQLTGEQRLRAGFKQIRSFSEQDGLAIEEARRAGGPFRSLLDFCDRVDLDRGKREKLADAGAFDGFGLDRRQALWEVSGWRRRLPLEGAPKQVMLPGFPAMSDAELNLLDHSVAGFSPQEHPLVHVREAMRRRGILTSEELTRLRDGEQVTTGGLVIARQRPGTAKGTFFITLEDEFGFSNLIVRARTFEKHRRLLTRVKFLQCSGRLQIQKTVVSVLADRFVDLARERLLQAPDRIEKRWGGLQSRDFR